MIKGNILKKLLALVVLFALTGCSTDKAEEAITALTLFLTECEIGTPSYNVHDDKIDPNRSITIICQQKKQK